MCLFENDASCMTLGAFEVIRYFGAENNSEASCFLDFLNRMQVRYAHRMSFNVIEKIEVVEALLLKWRLTHVHALGEASNEAHLRRPRHNLQGTRVRCSWVPMMQGCGASRREARRQGQLLTAPHESCLKH